MVFVYSEDFLGPIGYLMLLERGKWTLKSNPSNIAIHISLPHC